MVVHKLRHDDYFGFLADLESDLDVFSGDFTDFLLEGFLVVIVIVVAVVVVVVVVVLIVVGSSR